jgi:hypothetical protein
MGTKAQNRKEKIVEVGILNFKIHTKAPKKYERLFEFLTAVEHVKVRGSEFGTIGYLRKSQKDFLFGEIYLFLNIDPSALWYDAEKRAPVEADAIGMETRIFDRLKPHLKQKLFLFDLRNHRLFFDSKGFSPSAARLLFEQLCEEAAIIDQIGEIDIEIHSTQESVQQILKIPTLTYLEISLTLPNPEDLTDAQEALYSELRAEGILKYKEIRRSTKDVGITPNRRTADLVEISRTEGSAIGIGFEADQPIRLSTQEHPEIIRESYFTLTERPMDAFLRVADQIYNKFVRL